MSALEWQRPVVAAAVGAVVGVLQYLIVTSGMHAAAKRHGLSGIGVGFEYAVVVAVVSLILLAIAASMLRLRMWAFAALCCGLLDLLLTLFAWPVAGPIGLSGDSAAVLCIPSAAVAMALVGTRWKRRA